METPPREYLLPNPKLRLREQVREVARFRHISLRTEQSYWEWIRRFIQFHRKPGTLALTPALSPEEREKSWRHPREMAETEVREFLVHLAAERRVSASTQNQALNALVFLYRHVLGKPIGFLGDFERAHRPKLAREVLTKEETKQLLAAIPAGYRLFFQLLYGTGLRLLEGLRLKREKLLALGCRL